MFLRSHFDCFYFFLFEVRDPVLWVKNEVFRCQQSGLPCNREVNSSMFMTWRLQPAKSTLICDCVVNIFGHVRGEKGHKYLIACNQILVFLVLVRKH